MIGTHRSPGKAGQVRALGAQPVALDLPDSDAVRKAVLEAQPDAIVHEATALANAGFSRSLDRGFAGTNRLRTEAPPGAMCGGWSVSRVRAARSG